MTIVKILQQCKKNVQKSQWREKFSKIPLLRSNGHQYLVNIIPVIILCIKIDKRKER